MAGSAWALNADNGSPEYHAAQARRLLGGLLFGGDADRLGARSGVRPGHGPVVELSGTTVIVQAHQGVIYPAETSTQGPYPYEETGESLPLDPADGSQTRIDLVVERLYDDDQDSSGQRKVEPELVVGVPGSGAPSVPAGALELGRVTVPSDGSPTLQYTARSTVTSGAVLPVRDSGEYPAGGLYDGQTVFDQDVRAVMVAYGGQFLPLASTRPTQMVVYTSDDTFQKADFPWAKAFRVRVQAGGGGGGGAESTSSGQASMGTGGGSGGYAESILTPDVLSPSEDITVGSGGSGNPGANGSAGGGSSFGSHVVAAGGAGGGFSNASSSNAAGTNWGSGGTASAGQVRVNGAPGNSSFRVGTVAMSGAGGASHMGPGGNARGNGAGSTSQPSGTSGRMGGGGAGTVNGTSAGSNSPGGNGGDGIVIVEVYG